LSASKIHESVSFIQLHRSTRVWQPHFSGNAGHPEFLVFNAKSEGEPQFVPLARERGQRARVAKKGATFDGILRFCELAAAPNTFFGSALLKRLSRLLQKAVAEIPKHLTRPS
jgi:hypothetical protein